MTFSMTRPTWIETNLDAIAHNTRTLRTLVGPDVNLMAVLKADAYGHGALHVARVALSNGATHLALATLSEAAALREAGIMAPILLLGYTPPWQARTAIKLRLAVTLFDTDLARALSAAAVELDCTTVVHIKVDTGMSRLGLLPADVPEFMRWASTLPGLELGGIYTHLATADGAWMCDEEQGDKETRRQGNKKTGGQGDKETGSTSFSAHTYAHLQLDRFDALLALLEDMGLRPPLVHAANSAALLRMRRADGRATYNLVRPGLAMYGLAPFDMEAETDEQTRRIATSLRPVLAWRTHVARVAELPAGTPVSYGATYITPGVRRIATLPVGYADGLRRSPSWRAVLLRGQRAPIVGRICMDYAMCDVTEIEGVTVGDVATLIGTDGDERISAEKVADWLGTSVYEVLTSIGARVPRYPVT